MLPVACRNFPRVTLLDPRGMFITLSHFCPTAAALLLDDREIAIVEAPAALSLDGAVEGLDATARPSAAPAAGHAHDPDGYGGWEREAVATFNDRSRGARDALAVIAAATDDVRAWQPGGDSLATRVSEAFHRARSSSAPPGARAVVPRTWDQGVPRGASLRQLERLPGRRPGRRRPRRRQRAATSSDCGTLAGERLARSLGEGDSRAPFIAAVRAADFRLRHSRTDVRPRSLSSLRRD